MTATTTRVRLLLGILLPCALIFAIVFLQFHYDKVRVAHLDPHAPVHRFAMPAPIVRHLAFGFENALADYYWINVVQDVNKWDKLDVFYPEYFRIITVLDPKFEYPYIFATLTIPSRANPASLEWLADIADRGISALPQSWQIPFYLGVQYHYVTKSYERAVHYLAIAREEPSAPEIVRSTYAIYLMHTANDYQQSRALFAAIYETTDNEETKKIAQERIALIDFIEALDIATPVYRAKYGTYPTSVQELVASGLLRVSSELVKKFSITIDQSTGKATLK